jgi:hypothetical protein
MEDVKKLLTAVQGIVKHQEEIKRLKGEHFNVFSILGMESAENKTHSAFLGELLNPKGSHLMGDVFLRLFLKQVRYSRLPPDDKERIKAKVVLEKHIGWRNDKTKEGGRIDIYIEFDDKSTVSIENKIYAGDQYAQIERYHKHNSGKNLVYYLTLDGSDPTYESKGDLKPEEHYYCISYRTDILGWLKECIKQAADQPILRETIKQYMILIQKLTGQLTEQKMSEELYTAIGNNYQAAKIVAGGLWAAEDYAVRNFLNKAKEKIEAKLTPKENWTVRIHDEFRVYGTGLEVFYNPWKENIGVKADLRRHIIGGEKCQFGIVVWRDAFEKNEIVDSVATEYGLNDVYHDQDWHWRYEEVDLFQSQEQIDRLFRNDYKDIDLWTQELSEKFVNVAISCCKQLETLHQEPKS